MLVRICPVCRTEREQQELFCERRDDSGDLCNTDLSREPLVPPISAGEPSPATTPLEPRWVCANGHDAAPGDYLCSECAADVRCLHPNETVPAQPVPASSFSELPQLPLEPLEPLQACIGDWVIAGVVLEANFSEGPHPCRHQDGRLGEVHFADLDLIETLVAACPERMCRILDRGDWRGRRFAILEVLPSFNEVATDFDAIRVLVEQIGVVLDRLHRMGFWLRSLSPRAIRCRPGEAPDFVLSAVRDVVRADAVADLVPPRDLDPFHAAPEVLAGSVAPQSDWWSLGTIILDLATEGACFAGIHRSVWRMHTVTSDVPLPETLLPSLDHLLRGLLTRDLERRWKWPEVKAWLEGKPVEAPSLKPQPADRGSAILLGGAPYRSFARYAIAAASDEHWDEGRGLFERGELLAWCVENDAEERCLAGLRRVATALIDSDLKSAIALKCVYPDLPLVRRGEIINAAWLIHNPVEGYDLITGAAADLLDRLGFEPELVRLRDRASVIRRRLNSSQIAVDEPELRARLLVTNIRKLELEWERRRAAFPESEHRGLARLMRRFKLTEDDLIILNSAALTQFKPASEIIDEAAHAARKVRVALDAWTGAELLRAKTGYEILKQAEAQIANFARCGIEPVDAWADSLRSSRILPLSQALIILAVPSVQWKKPEGLEYSARLLKFFEDKIALAIKRGPLTRMTVTATSERIDLMEFNSVVSPSERLLEALLERGTAPPINSAAFTGVPGLEYRYTRLARHVAQYKRDTGVDCLVLGFPFILYKSSSVETKPRIAPLFLWPIKMSDRCELAYDADRAVALNPALDGFMTPAEIIQARAVADEIKDGGSLMSVLDDCERILKVEGRELGRLPPADIKVKSNKLVPAAVLFAAIYPGQSLINDLRNLQARPVTGTALATLFRTRSPDGVSFGAGCGWESQGIGKVLRHRNRPIPGSRDYAILDGQGTADRRAAGHGQKPDHCEFDRRCHRARQKPSVRMSKAGRSRRGFQPPESRSA